MINCYIEEIEYATSFYEKAEAKEIISTLDDRNDYKFKIVPYEGTFVIEIHNKVNKKFLGFYSD